MRTHHVKPGFHIAGFALAVLGTTVRLIPYWPKAPDLREATLIAVDAVIAYGVVWAAGWGLAWCSDEWGMQEHGDDEERIGAGARTPSPNA
jgi:hypothetical protein